MSTDQVQFRAKCVRMGWVYSWTSDLDEALRILEGWGALLPSLYKRSAAELAAPMKRLPPPTREPGA